ncbi:MAG: HD domain-containing protein [bacterium]|nr:HD domain-containing protein [bacterium]
MTLYSNDMSTALASASSVMSQTLDINTRKDKASDVKNGAQAQEAAETAETGANGEVSEPRTQAQNEQILQLQEKVGSKLEDFIKNTGKNTEASGKELESMLNQAESESDSFTPENLQRLRELSKNAQNTLRTTQEQNNAQQQNKTLDFEQQMRRASQEIKNQQRATEGQTSGTAQQEARAAGRDVSNEAGALKTKEALKEPESGKAENAKASSSDKTAQGSAPKNSAPAAKADDSQAATQAKASEAAGKQEQAKAANEQKAAQTASKAAEKNTASRAADTAKANTASKTEAKPAPSQNQQADAKATSAKNASQAAQRETVNAKNQAQNAKLEAQNTKTQAQAAKLEAQNTKTQAQAAKQEAQTAKTQAQTAQREAQNAKNQAQIAQREAQNAKTQAQNAKLEAQNAKNQAMQDARAAAVKEDAQNARIAAHKNDPAEIAGKFEKPAETGAKTAQAASSQPQVQTQAKAQTEQAPVSAEAAAAPETADDGFSSLSFRTMPMPSKTAAKESAPAGAQSNNSPVIKNTQRQTQQIIRQAISNEVFTPTVGGRVEITAGRAAEFGAVRPSSLNKSESKRSQEIHGDTESSEKAGSSKSSGRAGASAKSSPPASSGFVSKVQGRSQERGPVGRVEGYLQEEEYQPKGKDSKEAKPQPLFEATRALTAKPPRTQLFVGEKYTRPEKESAPLPQEPAGPRSEREQVKSGVNPAHVNYELLRRSPFRAKNIVAQEPAENNPTMIKAPDSKGPGDIKVKNLPMPPPPHPGGEKHPPRMPLPGRPHPSPMPGPGPHPGPAPGPGPHPGPAPGPGRGPISTNDFPGDGKPSPRMPLPNRPHPGPNPGPTPGPGRGPISTNDFPGGGNMPQRMPSPDRSHPGPAPGPGGGPVSKTDFPGGPGKNSGPAPERKPIPGRGPQPKTDLPNGPGRLPGGPSGESQSPDKGPIGKNGRPGGPSGPVGSPPPNRMPGGRGDNSRNGGPAGPSLHPGSPPPQDRMPSPGRVPIPRNDMPGGPNLPPAVPLKDYHLQAQSPGTPEPIPIKEMAGAASEAVYAQNAALSDISSGTQAISSAQNSYEQAVSMAPEVSAAGLSDSANAVNSSAVYDLKSKLAQAEAYGGRPSTAKVPVYSPVLDLIYRPKGKEEVDKISTPIKMTLSGMVGRLDKPSYQQQAQVSRAASQTGTLQEQQKEADKTKQTNSQKPGASYQPATNSAKEMAQFKTLLFANQRRINSHTELEQKKQEPVSEKQQKLAAASEDNSLFGMMSLTKKTKAHNARSAARAANAPSKGTAEQEKIEQAEERRNGGRSGSQGKAAAKQAAAPAKLYVPIQERMRMQSLRLTGSANSFRLAMSHLNSKAMEKTMDAAIRTHTTPVMSLLKRIYRRQELNDLSETDAINLTLFMLKLNGDDAYDDAARNLEFAMDIAEEMDVRDDKALLELRQSACFKDIGELGLLLAKEPEEKLDDIAEFVNSKEMQQAAMLHDIGNMKIPKEILMKKGQLTQAEYDLLRAHPIIGEEMIYPIVSLRHLCPTVRGHHERWDGQGYPDGLKGEKITLAARILSISDAFSALTREAPGDASKAAEAIEVIRQGSGTHFDPQCVEAFTRVAERRFPQRRRRRRTVQNA